MNSKKDKLVNFLTNKPVIIWGARMTGMGFLRFSTSNNLNVLNFVDSDPALLGNKVNNTTVRAPNDLALLKQLNPSLIVVIAVSIKEDEIIKQLKMMGFTDDDFVLYSDYCDVFYTIDVVGTCNLRCASCAYTIEGQKYSKGLISVPEENIIRRKKENKIIVAIIIANLTFIS